ncbi:putative chitinase [Luteibacter rhizovicinus]|uniref:Putative chitinase n=1 Tax=Luteibacter rhizovicinus TaxID=242606 RepID=A0A4R3YZA1_9GAMM|nr:XVIPCD domain-containing protein [Luteibacter rhizovicinus]TCV97218.1 putative chitinase [Luteibacter rhizovicinus]
MAIDREAQVLSEAAAAGIKSPRELANFMAQVTHESNGLNRLEEGFRYTKGISQIPVESAWRQGPEKLEAARKDALQGKPEHLAELMYGGRNGNDQPGDGYKYHGRGYIQLTGKDNYRAAGEALGVDLVKHPELAAEPKTASKIAVWYWENRVPEAAREDVKAATKAVNGKYNGLEDRRERFADWEKKLTPEVMERLSKGVAELPAQTHPQRSHDAPQHASPGTSLKQGADGEAVRKLQSDLGQLGYTDASKKTLHADGDFGPATKSALEAFQRDHHLKVDGVAGPKTLEAVAHQQQLATANREHTPAPQAHAPLRLDNVAHPDHTLYEQARNAVHRLDAQHHRAPDQQSDNLAAALTVAARREGMSKIDHVSLSDDASRAYAVQGDLNSPLKRVADVQTQQAVTTPVEKSSAALAQTEPAAQPSHEREQQRQVQQPTNPAHSM